MKLNRPLKTLGAVALAMAVYAGAGGAHANCAPVLDALDKADRQPRVALYDIDRPDQPLTGQPTVVRIGKVLYERIRGGDFERSAIDDADPTLQQALRQAVREGRARCEAAGDGNWRETAVTRFRFDNPLLPKQYNPTTIWIAKSTGLPVYHEVNGMGPGGHAWVYGDAVRAPATSK